MVNCDKTHNALHDLGRFHTIKNCYVRNREVSFSGLSHFLFLFFIFIFFQ